MNNLIIYSLETAVSLALFYTAYWIFLINETFFTLNRIYLLCSVAISLAMPLLNITIGTDSFISKNLSSPIDQYEQSMFGNHSIKNEMIVHAHKNTPRKPEGVQYADDFNPAPVQANPLNSAINSNQKTNWLTLVLVIYFIGVILFLIRFVANFIWIFGFALKHKSQQIFGVKVIRLKKKISPFSFLNFIFIGQDNYADAELTKIIAHEKIHIQQKHSIDLILFELLLAFQWFNPFVWLYKNAIKITHEYLADQGTLNSGIALPEYQYSLLNQALTKNNFEIASNYNLSIKKRIDMMTKKRSQKLAVLKLASALPVIAFLFSAFAFCTAAPDKEVTLNQENKSIVPIDTTIKKVNVSGEYLKLLEGEYVSTNEPNYVRRIILTELLGTLYGYDNGYTYKIIPVGDGKFINPDDHAQFVFDTKDKNAISFLLFGKINLNKQKTAKAPGNIKNKSLAFTCVNVVLKDGIAAGLSYYNKAKDSSNYFISQDDMNYAGYALLDAGKAKEAAAIFKINTELFPDLFNMQDSYGEALLALGEKAGAIEAFKKSVQLNPGSVNGIKRLKELGVNTDALIKKFNVSMEYLKMLEGTYLSINEPNVLRMIKFSQEDGVLMGNDNGYHYKLIPVSEGKFINPDDGAPLIFNTKDKNAITLSLFGTINLKKVKSTKEPEVALKEYTGHYLPAKPGDIVMMSTEIILENKKLYRFIESESQTPNRKIELEFVTGNLFFYTDNSRRSIEFIVDDKKQVTGFNVNRPDGTFKLIKQK